MNKRFKILIVGAGRVGSDFDRPTSIKILTHAHAFSRHHGFELVGFVDTDFKKACRAAKIWGGSAFKNIGEVFKNQQIDVVVNATPDEIHPRVLNEVLKFPIKLIFTEKPLTKSAKEAVEIISLAKKKKVKIVTNYTRRFVPEFQRLAAEIRAGAYGKYLTGTGYFGKGTKHNGSHLIDLLRFWVGEIKQSEVINCDYDFTADDPAVSAVLKFANGRPFFLQHVNRKLYTIFEADLLFERARFRVIDSGFKIETQKIKADKIFAGYKKMTSDGVKRTAMDKALYFAADDIYRQLQGRRGVHLDDGYQTLLASVKLVNGKL